MRGLVGRRIEGVSASVQRVGHWASRAVVDIQQQRRYEET